METKKWNREDRKEEIKREVEKVKEKIRSMFKQFQEADNREKADIIKSELFDVAEKLKKLEGKKTSKHQIRKYYHYFLDILESVRGSDFGKRLPKIAMARSYIRYDEARGNVGGIFTTFVESFVENALECKDEREFQNLLILFEALVGYTYDLRK